MSNKWLIVAIMFLTMSAHAQEPAAPPPPVSEIASPATTPTASRSDKITEEEVGLVNVKVADILQGIQQEFAGIAICQSESDQTRIKVKGTNEQIASVKKRLAELDVLPILVEIYTLKNTKSSDVLANIEADDPLYKMLNTVKGTDDQLSITGTAEQIEIARRKVSYLDHPAGYEIVLLNNISVEELLTKLGPHPVAKYMQPIPANRQVAIYGSSEQIAEAKQMISYIDKEEPLLKVTFAILSTDMDANKTKDFSLLWRQLSATAAMHPGTWTWSIGSGVINASTTSDKEVVAKLAYYHEQGKVELLANPQLTTRSVTELHIYFGDTYNVPVFNPTTGVIISNASILAGTDLTVTPIAGADGRITLIAKGNVPSVAGSGPQESIVTSDRKFNLVYSGLLNGQSVIVTGYKYSMKAYSERRIPIIDKLPLLGKLTRSKRSTNVNKEVSIAIAAYFVDPKSTSAVQTFAKEALKREPVGTPGVESTTPIAPLTTPLENKPPTLEKGRRVEITTGPNFGKSGLIVDTRTIETVNPSGIKEMSPEYQVQIDEGETVWFTPQDLKLKEDKPKEKPTTPPAGTPTAPTPAPAATETPAAATTPTETPAPAAK